MTVRRPIGFDNQRYLDAQVEAILERVERTPGRLYIEFGGKLLQDHHAARVLPGFDPDVKTKPLLALRDRIQILFCVNARDIQKGRVRGDFGLTYDLATLRTLDHLRERGLPVSDVVVTRYCEQPQAASLVARMERRGVRVATHGDVPGYPEDVDLVASEQGFGRNRYVDVDRPIVVVAGAGPGSGKIETALQQIWHEHRMGLPAGFAKWETFPVWDLPLDHPVNVAYEAATADIQDRNMVDPFHLEAYGVEAVNYNRDVEHFPILRELLRRAQGAGTGSGLSYRSPTDMCVNCASTGIVDDGVVREASRQEIIRRYLRYRWEHALCAERPETVEIAKKLMERVAVRVEDRRVVVAARRAAREAEMDSSKGYRGTYSGTAIELPSRELVTGKGSPRLFSTAAAVLNALKRLAGIPDRIDILSPTVLRNLSWLKHGVFEGESECLDISEPLRALSVSAPHNPAAEAAFQVLPELRGCELHTTHMPSESDQETLRTLRIMFTTDVASGPGGRSFSAE